MVQDYEPIFYANGDERLLAEMTYRLKDRFIPIVNTSILLSYYIDRNYNDFKKYGCFFEPSFDKRLFKPLTNLDFKLAPSKKKKVMFFLC